MPHNSGAGVFSMPWFIGSPAPQRSAEIADPATPPAVLAWAVHHG
jgi:hypothetical protein